MTLRRWRKISEEIRYSNPWWTYKLDYVELPTGITGEYHYVETPGSVMVIPMDFEEKILLVEQYRYLNGRNSLEFPGGGIHPGRSPEQAALQELAEETGLCAENISLIGVFNPFNGVTNEMCHVFLASELSKTSSSPEETEEFNVYSYTISEIRTLVNSGVIWDGMTLASWTFFQKYLVDEGRI